MPGHDPQLLNGVLSLLLLQLLAEQESYGYEVVQRLHDLLRKHGIDPGNGASRTA